MLKRLSLVQAALLLSACATGPDYRIPTVNPTAAAPFVHSSDPTLFSGAQADGQWWRLYHDAVLDRLIADALAANTDIRVAVARLDKARALLREQRSARQPQVSLDAGAQLGRVNNPLGGSSGTDVQSDVGLSVGYEADLFGRIGRGIEASRGDAAAAAFDADAVRVAIVSQTASAYADALTSAEQIKVAQRIVGLLDQALSLTDKRHRVGLANGLDVARIATLREQRAADVPLLTAQREAALLRLATLTGRTPRELPAEVVASAGPLRIDQPLPVGDGAGLLARRPDVRASERRLAAATARIGVATADLYPRITLGGSVGSSGSGIGNLFTGNPLTWLVGPLINWTVNRSAARARVEGSRADERAALATFDGTVLQALQETETALSNYRLAIVRRNALGLARDQAAKATTITRARQREGDISSLELLDSERTSADAQAAVAEADARIAQAQIGVFRALGGSWSS